MSEEKTYCTKCGTEIKEGDVFCSKCGAKTVESQEGYVLQTKPKKKSIAKKIMYGIGGIIGLFIVLVIIGAMIGPQHPSNTSPSNTSNSIAAPTVTPTQDPSVATIYEQSEVQAHNYQMSPVENNENAIFACFYAGDTYDIYSAPTGYTYVVAAIKIDNKGFDSISTNPYKWTLTTNRVSYTPDTATFSMKQPLTEIGHGGQGNLAIIYAVPKSSTKVILDYNG